MLLFPSILIDRTNDGATVPKERSCQHSPPCCNSFHAQFRTTFCTQTPFSVSTRTKYIPTGILLKSTLASRWFSTCTGAFISAPFTLFTTTRRIFPARSSSTKRVCPDVGFGYSAKPPFSTSAVPTVTPLVRATSQSFGSNCA